MRRPKVTVYIIAYNAASGVEESIQSVMEQTLQDFELIVVDDGSTDETGQMLEKYRYHPKIRIFKQPHKGIAAASNIAVLYARGEYICPLYQGDRLTPDALEILSRELDEDINIGFIFSGHYKTDNSNQSPVVSNTYVPGLFISEMPILKSMMWRKSKFILTEGFDKNLLYYFNYDILLKLEEVCKVKQANSMLYKQNTTESNYNYFEELIFVFCNVFRRRNLQL